MKKGILLLCLGLLLLSICSASKRKSNMACQSEKKFKATPQ